MKVYKTKLLRVPGTSYSEIEVRARKLYSSECKRTKRNPYVRSIYFKKDKVFLKHFWNHLMQKPRRDRKRRLIYYACALDLIRHNRFEPTTKENPNNRRELVHRFTGITKNKEIFYVQISENKKTGNKYFMSVFSGR